MKVFTPIELAIPNFGMARVVLMHYLPRYIELRFDHIDPQVMRLDYEWASKALRALPVFARSQFLAMLDSASQAIVEAIPADRMPQFVREPATQETLRRANNELQIIDLERERAGLPTFLQLIKHHLGIEAAPGTVAVTMNIAFGGRDPYEQA